MVCLWHTLSHSPSRVCSHILFNTLRRSADSEHRYSPACRALTLLMTSDESLFTWHRPLQGEISSVSGLSPTAHVTLPPILREEVLLQESDTDSLTAVNTSSIPSRGKETIRYTLYTLNHIFHLGRGWVRYLWRLLCSWRWPWACHSETADISIFCDGLSVF